VKCRVCDRVLVFFPQNAAAGVNPWRHSPRAGHEPDPAPDDWAELLHDYVHIED
jgi:hypothetical protein